MSVSDRVAVVAVHGIADQQPGQTVRELARLLCHCGAGEPRYVHGEMHEVLVPVARLDPGGARTTPATPPAAGAGPRAETSRRRPGTPSGFYQVQRSVSAAAAPPTREPDLGLALNDYLLGRLELSERDALYESTRVEAAQRLSRTGAPGARASGDGRGFHRHPAYTVTS